MCNSLVDYPNADSYMFVTIVTTIKISIFSQLLFVVVVVT